MSDGARVFSVLSGKGGTGKTNICVNLGVALQRLGKKVLIIDGDLGLANIEVILGLTPRFTLYDVLYRNVDLESVITYGPESILIIPGGSGALELSRIEPYKQELLMEKMIRLGDSLDYIFIDGGAGIHQDVLSFASGSDEILLVMTPEPTALADAYTLVKAISMLKKKKSIKVIVNRIKNLGEGEDTVNRLNILLERFLKISVTYLGSVPDDIWVERAVREQNLFVTRYAFSKSARAINDIAVKLIGKEAKGTGFRGFLKGLFERVGAG
ncbi:TPA: MinD/ParA family protein [bacterium]|jgi:flagellar biosynthesis protein FlhG|nr:MinD/ParA family protein [bacterium]